jgi:hypothetical protein
MMIHTDDGPYVLGCLYRPPCTGNTEGIDEIRAEIVKHKANAIGTLLIGDVNVHSKRWLTHSAGESKEASCLRAVCDDMGLKQWVSQPTRKHTSGSDHLLDLVMADIEVVATVGGTIRDHRYVLTKMKAPVPDSVEVEREAWNYSKADWVRLKDELRQHDWTTLHSMNADEAATSITDIILRLAKECIGKRKLEERKTTHPWLTPEIMRLTAEKKKAEGTEEERAAIERCSSEISASRLKYQSKTREDFCEMAKGTKQWWTKSGEMLGK